jgi:hypothetical protein
VKSYGKVNQLVADGGNTFLNVKDCGYGGIGIWTSASHEKADNWKTNLYKHENGGTYMFAQFGSKLDLDAWLKSEDGKNWILVMECC